MSRKLSVSPLFDYEKVEYSQSSEVHLDVILEAPEKQGEKRTPLHMILAIDCSGSMSGNKLPAVKSTVNKLIDHLTEDDTVGIVAFSDNAWEAMSVLPMSNSNKDMARNAVNRLSPMSMTNMSEALRMSMERAVTAEKDKVCRIVLLTDGLPTTGDSSREGLVKLVGGMNQQITLTTFGYGADYDPELLTSLSSIGKGNNFYIQSDDDCKRAFAMELGGLLSTYGQNIKVTIAPTGNMVLKELLSLYQLEEKQGYRGITNGKAELSIDDIYYGEKKHVVLKMEVPKATSAVCARPSKVCDILIEYVEAESKKTIDVSSTAKIQYTKAGQGTTEPNPIVRKQLALLEAARIQKEAKEKADSGDFQGAQEVLTGAITWASNNVSWMPEAQNLVADFSSLAANARDRFSYHTVGAKMATSNLRAYYSNRGSSADSMKSGYMSTDQMAMLDSFGVSDSEPQSGYVSSDSGISIGGNTIPQGSSVGSGLGISIGGNTFPQGTSDASKDDESSSSLLMDGDILPELDENK